ncbi:MAG: NAD-dependent DNA ligase LigA [Candidatus Moranbacteria bacterium]|nr:NAD-dependent DNA ligase LigA [Candidatus Moranbacteria bacterium]
MSEKVRPVSAKATPRQASRAEKLKKVIDEYRYRYHVLDDPTLTDTVYDSLMEELRGIERQYPELKTSDSPTQRIGGEPLKKFEKVKHRIRQWSLDDAFSFEELEDWETRNKKILEKKGIEIDFDYIVELKIDGLKIVLDYEKGILQQGATRGDGVIGEKVTENIKTIKSVPLKLNREIDLTVTGECWLPVKELKRINKERRGNNLPEFANSRNAGAGSMRQLDSKVAASRNLDSYIYSLEEIRSNVDKPKTQEEELEFLIDLGFKVNRGYHFFKSLEDIKNFCQEWESKKDNQPYGIDGLVVKINSKKYQEELGYTGKSPRFAIAWKFSPEQVTTQIEDVKIQIGRTGALTPVAVLKPVKVAGSVVSRATLHNEDEIIKKDIKIGDTVVIHKAGDVIPEVVEVIKKLRTGKEREFKMPSKCPMCGGEVIREKIADNKKNVSSAHFCVNQNCFAVEREKVIHFVSKKGMNIDGLGKRIVEQLMNEGLISSVADIYSLTLGDLEPLERFAQKSAENLIEAIDKSKQTIFEKLLFGLGIRHFGEEGGALLKKELENGQSALGKKYQTMGLKISRPGDLITFFSQISAEDLFEINGFGERIAQSVVRWFKKEENRSILKKLDDRGVEMKPLQSKASIERKKLDGKIFVLTGSMAELTREDAKALIKEEGGKISSSVSKNTDFVVAGEKPGSKYEKALELKIKILSEKDLINLLK